MTSVRRVGGFCDNPSNIRCMHNMMKSLNFRMRSIARFQMLDGRRRRNHRTLVNTMSVPRFQRCRVKGIF